MVLEIFGLYQLLGEQSEYFKDGEENKFQLYK